MFLIRVSLPTISTQAIRLIRSGFNKAIEWSANHGENQDLWVEQHVKEIVDKLLKERTK